MAIINQIPVNFDTNIIRNVFIQIQFDEALDRSTIREDTVILVRVDTQDVISGSVDYVAGTSTITFQLFEPLDANTDYQVLLVGGDEGIHKLYSSEPFSHANYTFSFKTGEIVDPNVPLARDVEFEDGPYFQGQDGIYNVVWGRTGEPISHVVTTAAQVGPSGQIIPAPFDADRYLPPSGATPDGEIFQLVSSDPENEEAGSVIDEIRFTFNANLALVGEFEITVADVLDYELPIAANIDNYYGYIDGKDYVIAPTGSLTEFPYAANYSVTLSDISDTGTSSIDEASISFTTKIKPFYATVKAIRTNLGPLISSVPNADIELIIYENSVWAYEHAKIEFPIDEPTDAAKNYVICKTKLDLLDQRFLEGGQAERKTLADLTIEYGSGLAKVVTGKMDRLLECIKKNELLLTTGYGFVTMTSAVKSYYDPRYPTADNISGTAVKWRRLADRDFTEE